MGTVNNLSTYALAETLLFLPGAAGNLQLWQPVSAGLVKGGTHDLVADRASEVIPCIETHLAS